MKSEREGGAGEHFKDLLNVRELIETRNFKKVGSITLEVVFRTREGSGENEIKVEMRVRQVDWHTLYYIESLSVVT